MLSKWTHYLKSDYLDGPDILAYFTINMLKSIEFNSQIVKLQKLLLLHSQPACLKHLSKAVIQVIRNLEGDAS